MLGDTTMIGASDGAAMSATAQWPGAASRVTCVPHSPEAGHQGGHAHGGEHDGLPSSGSTLRQQCGRKTRPQTVPACPLGARVSDAPTSNFSVDAAWRSMTRKYPLPRLGRCRNSCVRGEGLRLTRVAKLDALCSPAATAGKAMQIFWLNANDRAISEIDNPADATGREIALWKMSGGQIVTALEWPDGTTLLIDETRSGRPVPGFHFLQIFFGNGAVIGRHRGPPGVTLDDLCRRVHFLDARETISWSRRKDSEREDARSLALPDDRPSRPV